MTQRRLSQKEADARLIAQGRHLASTIRGLMDRRHDGGELAGMNHRKDGRPYKYADSLMMSLAVLRYSFDLSFRVIEGLALGLGGKAPHFSQIWRRINGMDVDYTGDIRKVEGDDFEITMIADGTGLTPAARGEYIRAAHKVRRGFIRFTIMINHDTQEIIGLKATDERTGETNRFERFLDDSLRNIGVDPDKRRQAVADRPAGAGVDAGIQGDITIKLDGAYDDRNKFSICRKLGITPRIRIRTDAGCRAKGKDRTRVLAAKEQLGGDAWMSAGAFAALSRAEREANRKRWKKKVGFGRRWLVEIVISAFKSRFGNGVRARKMANILNELKMKAYIYNMMLRVGREDALGA